MGPQVFAKAFLRLLLHKSCFFALLVVFSASPVAECSTGNFTWHLFQPRQLRALQALWGAWNESTPDPAENLAGWNSDYPYPCSDDITVNRHPDWRGVECLKYVACTEYNASTGERDCYTFITGLTLDKASIVGFLPPAIGNISTLTTLKLTGNPGLTGTLPDTLEPMRNLYTLDLHNNNFYGEIPDFRYLRNVNLGGNQFIRNGTFPLPTMRMKGFAQTFSLGSNDLDGLVPEDAFQNMTQLVQLDLSRNRFSGAPPTLSTVTGLEVLDLSDNNFSGTLPDLTTMARLRSVNLSGNAFNGSAEIGFWNSLELQELDLSHNRFNGTPPDLSNVTSLELLDLSYNNFSGALPDLTTMAGLRFVNLSGNAFTGSALDFWNSSELQELHLDFNLIDGSLNISDLTARGFLSMRSSSGQLKNLSLMNNRISHVIYDVKKVGDFTAVIRLQGNTYCNAPDSDDGTRCFCTQVCKYTAEVALRAMARTDAKRKIRNIVITTVVTSVSILLILLACLAAFYHRSKKYWQSCEIQLQRKCEEFEVQPTIFPYNQLRIATRDFHPDMKLGQGSFGAVYKGILPNGNEVAVKQLFAKTTQSIDEFLNEVVLLTGMKHRNLVNLKGCCIREQQRLLVYEYVDNYDIDKILLCSKLGFSKTHLSWTLRLRICLGVARGLHYLHVLAQPRIIHRDIKASNILLTKSYETKIADFGLAFLFPDEESYILTKHVAGTKGYLAPEYASYGQLSDKVDVFSFGILCLEVVSGQRNIDKNREPNKMYLPKWAWDLHRQGNLIELIDPTMTLREEEKVEVHRLINIALLCIQNEAELRPKIEQVVSMLQGESDYQTMVPKLEMEEQYLESLDLLAFGNNNLAIVEEESELPFLKSLKRVADNSWRDSSNSGVLEYSETRGA